MLTCIGVVHQGKVDVPLAEFEGKKVVIQLASEDAAVTPSRMPDIQISDEPDLLDDLGRIDLPPRAVKTGIAEIVSIGRLPISVRDEED